jgi:hypothetical protein
MATMTESRNVIEKQRRTSKMIWEYSRFNMTLKEKKQANQSESGEARGELSELPEFPNHQGGERCEYITTHFLIYIVIFLCCVYAR